MRIGDCECWQDRFTEALVEYHQSLKLREEFDDVLYSRDLAEIHFLIGNTVVYENKDQCFEEAIKNYKASIDILERNLERHYKEKGMQMPQFDADKNGLKKKLAMPLLFDDEKAKEIKGVLELIYEKVVFFGFNRID